MLLVRGFALLILFLMSAIATDALVPDRDPDNRIGSRSSLIAAQSGEQASILPIACENDPSAQCAQIAALPPARP